MKVIKDPKKLRLLLAQKGIYKQKEFAEGIFTSENSVVRLFKRENVHDITAVNVARFVGAPVDELFDDAGKKGQNAALPKVEAGTVHAAIMM